MTFNKTAFKDSTGRTYEDLKPYLYTTFLHTGRQKLYQVQEIVYYGDSDEWGLLMQHVWLKGVVNYDAPKVFRTLNNILGNRVVDGNPIPRFIEVKNQ